MISRLGHLSPPKRRYIRYYLAPKIEEDEEESA
jgi:hypothetical protein